MKNLALTTLSVKLTFNLSIVFLLNLFSQTVTINFNRVVYILKANVLIQTITILRCFGMLDVNSLL